MHTQRNMFLPFPSIFSLFSWALACFHRYYLRMPLCLFAWTLHNPAIQAETFLHSLFPRASLFLSLTLTQPPSLALALPPSFPFALPKPHIISFSLHKHRLLAAVRAVSRPAKSAEVSAARCSSRSCTGDIGGVQCRPCRPRPQWSRPYAGWHIRQVHCISQKSLHWLLSVGCVSKKINIERRDAICAILLSSARYKRL